MTERTFPVLSGALSLHGERLVSRGSVGKFRGASRRYRSAAPSRLVYTHTQTGVRIPHDPSAKHGVRVTSIPYAPE